MQKDQTKKKGCKTAKFFFCSAKNLFIITKTFAYRSKNKLMQHL